MSWLPEASVPSNPEGGFSWDSGRTWAVLPGCGWAKLHNRMYWISGVNQNRWPEFIVSILGKTPVEWHFSLN